MSKLGIKVLVRKKRFRNLVPSELQLELEDPNRTLMIIPTLGERASLKRTLDSISQAGGAKVAIVCPNPDELRRQCLTWGHAEISYYQDQRKGIHNAICLVLDHNEKEDFDYVGWINDDDELTADSLSYSRAALMSDPAATFVFGDCEYINPEGEGLWISKFGKLAFLSLRLGPDLIPQPSCLFRFSDIVDSARPNPRFGQAFDFDVVSKLSRAGTTLYVPRTQSKFGWHPTSETVEFRWRSAILAAKVRTANAGVFLPLVLLMNPLVIVGTYLGRFVPSSNFLKRVIGG